MWPIASRPPESQPPNSQRRFYLDAANIKAGWFILLA